MTAPLDLDEIEAYLKMKASDTCPECKFPHLSYRHNYNCKYHNYHVKDEQWMQLVAEIKRLRKANIQLGTKMFEVSLESDELKRDAIELATYYGQETFYEPFRTMAGLREPGILAEKGEKARAFLTKYKGGEEWETI